MSIEPTTSGATEVSIRLSAAATERVQDLIGVGLAASIEDYVADSVRNRLAGFQDIGGPNARQPDGDPREWVRPTRT